MKSNSLPRVRGWPVGAWGLLIGLVTVFTTVLAGDLEPPASAFDASGNPIATGSGFPSWDRKLDASNGDTASGREGCDSDRFTCIWGDLAVRDNETGLVWERSPAGTGPFSTRQDVWKYCPDLELGGRKGWQHPTREELVSLIDPSNTFPALSTGHPFTNVPTELVYTSTLDREFMNVRDAGGFPQLRITWTVHIGRGEVFNGPELNTAPVVWCVRGGRHGDF